MKTLLSPLVALAVAALLAGPAASALGPGPGTPGKAVVADIKWPVTSGDPA
jgi:hypothetical protein